VPHYPVRGDALLRPTARNVLWRCADPPLAPQQEVQYTEGSGSHPHLGAGLLRAGARPLRQLVHVCVRAICRHVVILLVSDCMHQRKRSASLCRFRALSSAILPALPHGSREYSTLQEPRQPHGTSANAASQQGGEVRGRRCRERVFRVRGGRRTGGAVVVGGALRALVVQQPVHVDGGWEADLVAEHHPAASEQHKIFKNSQKCILRIVFSEAYSQSRWQCKAAALHTSLLDLTRHLNGLHR